MSNSVQPYGLQPARLLRSCDSPSKNTGVGSHFLLQGIFPHPGVEPNLYSRWIPYHLSHQGSPFHNIFTCQIICSPPETNIILYFNCFNLFKKKTKTKTHMCSFSYIQSNVVYSTAVYSITVFFESPFSIQTESRTMKRSGDTDEVTIMMFRNHSSFSFHPCLSLCTYAL